MRYSKMFKLVFQSVTHLHLPAYNHELPLRRTGPETLPQIHCENCAGAVEDGGQRGHEGSDHHRHHQASQPWPRLKNTGWST